MFEITKLNLGQYFEAKFGQDFNFRFSRDDDFEVNVEVAKVDDEDRVCNSVLHCLE